MIPSKASAIFNVKGLAWIASIFYGLLAPALIAITSPIASGHAASLKQLAIATLLSFSVYFYHKLLCFSSHHPSSAKSDIWNWFLAATLVLIAIILLLGSSAFTQRMILALSLVNLVYHNHSRIYLFRKIHGLKNVIVAGSWTIFVFYTFQSLQPFKSLQTILSVDFFLLLLAQSLLFDIADRKSDQFYGHTTWMQNISSGTAQYIIQSLFVLSYLVTLIGVVVFDTHLWKIPIASLLVYSIYLWWLDKNMRSLNSTFLFISDLVLLAKAVIWYIL